MVKKSSSVVRMENNADIFAYSDGSTPPLSDKYLVGTAIINRNNQ